MAWKIQGAQGELNDVVARSMEDGPQTIVRDGTEVAVIMSISDYHKLMSDHDAVDDVACTDSTPDFRHFLLSGPVSDEFAEELERIVRQRADSHIRDINL